MQDDNLLEITEGSSQVIPVSLDAGACYTCIKEKKREKIFNEDKTQKPNE